MNYLRNPERVKGMQHETISPCRRTGGSALLSLHCGTVSEDYIHWATSARLC